MIKNIIQEGFDSNGFSEFMNQERMGGCNIDFWTLEELETMVVLYKKNQSKQNPNI